MSTPHGTAMLGQVGQVRERRDAPSARSVEQFGAPWTSSLVIAGGGNAVVGQAKIGVRSRTRAVASRERIALP